MLLMCFFILVGMLFLHVSMLQSREESSIADDWDERPHTIEEVKAMLQQRKEATMKREKTLTKTFSQQVCLPLSHAISQFPLFLVYLFDKLIGVIC